MYQDTILVRFSTNHLNIMSYHLQDNGRIIKFYVSRVNLRLEKINVGRRGLREIEIPPPDSAYVDLKPIDKFPYLLEKYKFPKMEDVEPGHSRPNVS